jgi:hypothetical protein
MLLQKTMPAALVRAMPKIATARSDEGDDT